MCEAFQKTDSMRWGVIGQHHNPDDRTRSPRIQDQNRPESQGIDLHRSVGIGRFDLEILRFNSRPAEFRMNGTTLQERLLLPSHGKGPRRVGDIEQVNDDGRIGLARLNTSESENIRSARNGEWWRFVAVILDIGADGSSIFVTVEVPSTLADKTI